jgi:hypothetical protein
MCSSKIVMACISAPPLVHPILLMGNVVHKVGAGKAHTANRKTASKLSPRERAVLIARPQLTSSNSLTIHKCGARF